MSDRGGAATWWWAAVGGTGFLALIGIANPVLASRAALVGVVVLAGIALVLALRRLLERVGPAPVSPFSTPRDEHADRRQIPYHLEVLRPPETAGQAAMLSFGARVGVRTVTTERLWKQHRLNLWHPAHAAEIRRLVSDDLWATINVGAATLPIPQSALDRLLDEVEQL